MGLGGTNQIAPTRYNGLYTSQAVLGARLPIIIGQQRQSWQLFWYGDFSSAAAKTQGGSGMGKGGSGYVYTASVLAGVCMGECANFLAVWDSTGHFAMDTFSETFTVTGDYTPVNHAILVQDIGASQAATYSVTVNDYGSPAPVTLSGSQNITLTYTANPTPGPGEYTINGSKQYVFNAAQFGETVTVNYVAYRNNIQENELSVVPTTSPYQVTVQYQSVYKQDAGVSFYPSGVALAVVSGTPTVAGTYNPNGGNYLFAAADAGLGIIINYVYTGQNADENAPTTLNLTFQGGGLGQAPWSYLTSKHPEAAIGYSEVAYVASSGLYLGQSALLPQYSFEILGAYPFGGGIPDACPADAIGGILTNPAYGVNFYSGYIDTSLLGVTKDFWAANNYFISATINNETSALSLISEWCEAGATYLAWDEGLLKFIPLGDTSAVANGHTYTPPTQPVVDLDDSDFIVTPGNDPVQIEQVPWQSQWNRIAVKWSVRVESQQVVLVEACSADGGRQAEASMRAVPVVLVYPGGEVVLSLC